jgi:hypothetical protein
VHVVNALIPRSPLTRLDDLAVPLLLRTFGGACHPLMSGIPVD